MTAPSSIDDHSYCSTDGRIGTLSFSGSLKDRVAKKIVLEAEASGKLLPGGTIYEGTAGSTGIALASVAKARGYGCRYYPRFSCHDMVVCK